MSCAPEHKLDVVEAIANIIPLPTGIDTFIRRIWHQQTNACMAGFVESNYFVG